MTTSRIIGVKHRIAVEKQIAFAIIDSLVSAGFLVEINDGEGIVVEPTKNEEVLKGGLHTTDEDLLVAYRVDAIGSLKRMGWVQLIYGNLGWDIIADNTTTMEQFLEPAVELSFKIMMENVRDG